MRVFFGLKYFVLFYLYFLEMADYNAADKLDQDTAVVPKKFVDKLSLPPFTWGVNLLGKNKKSKERFIEEEEGKDGLLKSIVDPKLKHNGFFYYVSKK